MPTTRLSPRHLPLLALALTAACGGGGADAPHAEQPTSGATCPAGGTTLRFTGGGNGTTEPANFGSTFMATSCNGCHGSTVTGVARQGAPTHATFDQLAVVRDHVGLIDQYAAKGPTRTNTLMPPVGTPAPSDEDRALLGTWLACGAP